MKVSVETRGELERRLSVTVPAGEIGSRYREHLSRAAKDVRLKGFRPGRVPRAELERRFGGRLRQEVALDVARGAWQHAAMQESLSPATSPMIELSEWREGSDLHFHATFECMPEIELSDMSELSLVRPTVEISESDVDSVIGQMCQRLATWEEVTDRPSEQGDRLRLGFELTDPESGEILASQPDMIQPVKEFPEDSAALPPREGLVGVKLGEDHEYDWSVPEDYPSEQVAGRNLSIRYSIKQIEREVTPDPDDPRVLDSAKVENVEALRQETRISIERYRDELVASLLREQGLRRLSQSREFSLPEGLVQDQLRRDQSERDQLARLRGIDPDAESEDAANGSAHSKALQKERRARACDYVKAALLLRAVIEANSLRVEDDQLEAEVRKRASATPDPQAKYFEILQDEEELARIESELRQYQAMQFIVDHAAITDREESYESLLRLTPDDLMPDLKEVKEDQQELLDDTPPKDQANTGE